jgi:hypothetical protein
MVELYTLLCVVAIVETADNSSGHVRVIFAGYTVIGCQPVVNNADMPEAMVWVALPSEDDCAIVSYFASGCIEEYFPSGIA